MSRQNIDIPIFALTPRMQTRRKATLYRNVNTFELGQSGTREDVLAAAQNLLIEEKVVSPGDLIVLTWGEPMGEIGGTNTMKIMCVQKH